MMFKWFEEQTVVLLDIDTGYMLKEIVMIYELYKRGGGGHYINLDIFNDSNDVFLSQTNSGSHTADVRLYGTQPTDISLIQNAGSNKSYSVTNYCYTSGGCSISVTQQ